MSGMVDPAQAMPGNRFLVGRATERATIDTLIRDAERGVSGALLVHGSAGIGKSALVRYALDRASNFTVARTAGVESEMGFGYAGSPRRWCRCSTGSVHFPEHNARWSRRCNGKDHHDHLDPFVVGLALLSLLAEVARLQPALSLPTMRSGWTGRRRRAGNAVIRAAWLVRNRGRMKRSGAT